MAMDRYVWNLDAGCHGAWSTSEQLELCTWAQWTYFQFTMQEFSMVGGCTEDFTQNCQNWGWVLALDNTVVFEVRPLPCILNITDVIRHSLFFSPLLCIGRPENEAMFHMLYSSNIASCMQFGLLYLSFLSLLLRSAGRICGSISLPHSGQPPETNSRETTKTNSARTHALWFSFYVKIWQLQSFVKHLMQLNWCKPQKFGKYFKQKKALR